MNRYFTAFYYDDEEKRILNRKFCLFPSECSSKKTIENSLKEMVKYHCDGILMFFEESDEKT